MPTTDQSFYFQSLHIGKEFFDGVDRSLHKRHEINNFLGFGFRKDDVVLEPLKDRWTDPDNVPLDRLIFWVDNKLSPYVNHWGNPRERVNNNRILQALSGDVQKVIRELNQDLPKDPSGIEYTSISEIKMAVIFFMVNFVAGQKGVSISPQDARAELIAWKERADNLVQRLFDELVVPSGQQYQPLKKLVEEVNLFVSAQI